MILESIRMRRRDYGEDNGKMLGEVTFTDEAGSVTLNLDDEKCSQILAICAAQIVESAKAVATTLTSRVISADRLPTAHACTGGPAVLPINRSA